MTREAARKVLEADVTVVNDGTLFLFTPQTDAAREWLQENVQEDAMWFGGALVVEMRYAADLAMGLGSAGLKVA